MPVVCHAIAISFWSCSLQHLCRGWGVVRRERLSRQVVTVSSGLRSFLLMGTNWARFYHQNLIALFLFFELTKTESFYNVNYGSSVITSKRSSKNISLIKTNTCDDTYYKNSSFWNFNSRFILNTDLEDNKNTSVCFDYWDFLTNFLM